MENICLIIEYVLLALMTLSIIFGVISPLLIIVSSFIVNLLHRIIKKSKEPIMSYYSAPFVLSIGLMLAVSSLFLAVLLDLTVTQYYYPYLILY